MYLSRLFVNPRSNDVRRDQADCHDLHARVMSAFPQALCPYGARSEYSVLFRVDHTPMSLVLYVQSRIPPDWSHLPQGYLLYHGLDNPACKSVSEQYARLRSGMALRFRLRANPTKKIDTKTGLDGKRRNGRRVGIWKEEGQIDWLIRKGAASGFELVPVPDNEGVVDVLVLREPNVVSAKGPSSSQSRVFGSVLFEGHLRIVNHSLFVSALEAGIGSGKAYGFGLLSLAPAYGITRHGSRG